MSQDMLAQVVRSITYVPQQYLGTLNDIAHKLQGLEADILHGRLNMILRESSVSVPEPTIDPIIRVNRSISPAYPSWVKVLHPELENIGPAEFDVSKLELWLHKDQKDGRLAQGKVIYEYLKEKEILVTCLGLTDLLEIQKKGLAFFRKYFQDKAIFAWKSVVRHRDGDRLNAPSLVERGGQVMLSWGWLGGIWSDAGPAARFAS